MSAMAQLKPAAYGKLMRVGPEKQSGWFWSSGSMTDSQSAEESEDLLTPEATQKISAEISKSRRYTAKRTSERKYRVRAGDRRFMVDLQAKSCECNEFDLDDMPCSHAIAAIIEANEPVEDYVEAYYKLSSLVQTYSGSVNHLLPLEHWEIPFEIATDIVLPNLSR
ncbi:uncharacterized protein LOC131026075 [Salvia miltiorrhiza]|uniref:uncharacterized protein LOC131026075 n=1 Tax=Salvia miltiorrhiza TaxID=226208 RepID=UPI0025AD68B6|nr:uncharacterized protein LOC131026075 [Salvia miltiorrhiza]